MCACAASLVQRHAHNRCVVYIMLVISHPKDEWAQEEEEEEEKRKTVTLELVFGYHWKAGTNKSVGAAQLNRKYTQLSLYFPSGAIDGCYCTDPILDPPGSLIRGIFPYKDCLWRRMEWEAILV